MNSAIKQYLGLDVGEKRIGVARGDSAMRLAYPLETITVDGTEVERIKIFLSKERIDGLIIGFPRNQSGETTKQTNYVESFAEQLEGAGVPVVFQDESLTSVAAEQYLKASGKSYDKGAIDAAAACIILQDYLEETYGR